LALLVAEEVIKTVGNEKKYKASKVRHKLSLRDVAIHYLFKRKPLPRRL
jgi:hypothetical protein